MSTSLVQAIHVPMFVTQGLAQDPRRKSCHKVTKTMVYSVVFGWHGFTQGIAMSMPELAAEEIRKPPSSEV